MNKSGTVVGNAGGGDGGRVEAWVEAWVVDWDGWDRSGTESVGLVGGDDVLGLVILSAESKFGGAGAGPGTGADPGSESWTSLG